MVGWHHLLDGHGFGWTPGVGDGQEAWHAAVHGVAKSQTGLTHLCIHHVAMIVLTLLR